MPVLFLALFVPLFFHGFRFGIPYVKGGDEPHYLIMINSLLNDGDWDLKNNYESVWKGSIQAGKKFKGLPLHLQVICKLGDQLLPWTQVYDFPSSFKPNSKGQLPQLKPGIDYSKLKDYPMHPYGMPILLSTVLWPVKNTPY
ncbi:MAG: hypothetical protein ACREL1_00450, partial [bacterium]